MFISRVSTSCASGSGATTRTMGSLAKNTVPSGMRPTSPVKRRLASWSMKLRLKRFWRREPLELFGRERAGPRDTRPPAPGRRRRRSCVLGRQPAEEQLEHRGIRHAALVVGLQHGELVQIGEQRARAGIAGLHLRRRRGDRKSLAWINHTTHPQGTSTTGQPAVSSSTRRSARGSAGLCRDRTRARLRRRRVCWASRPPRAPERLQARDVAATCSACAARSRSDCRLDALPAGTSRESCSGRPSASSNAASNARSPPSVASNSAQTAAAGSVQAPDRAACGPAATGQHDEVGRGRRTQHLFQQAAARNTEGPGQRQLDRDARQPLADLLGLTLQCAFQIHQLDGSRPRPSSARPRA